MEVFKGHALARWTTPVQSERTGFARATCTAPVGDIAGIAFP